MEVLTFQPQSGGAFDLEIGPYSGVFDQTFLKKSNARGFARGGEMIAFGIDRDINQLRMQHGFLDSRYQFLKSGWWEVFFTIFLLALASVTR